MLRRLITGVAACAVLGTAQAQVITGAMFMPSPVGVILSIGQWISYEGEKTYYIEVLGEGATPDEARANGFRLAVEQAVGTVIASETEVNNSRITRDEIISYASGYVTKYEIVKQEPGGIGVKTTMKVWIKRNSIANRLLNESKTAGVVDGAQASVSFKSILLERESGDKLLTTVLNDYPRRSFDIELGQTKVLFDNRSPQLVIPYQIRLNSNYVDSLFNALKATEQKGPCAVAVKVNTQQWFGGGTVNYSEYSKYDLLASTIAYRPAKLQLTLYSASGDNLYRDVFPIKYLTPDPIRYTQPSLFNINNRESGCGRSILVNGGRWTYDDLLINNINPNLLAQVTRVELIPIR